MKWGEGLGGRVFLIEIYKIMNSVVRIDIREYFPTAEVAKSETVV